MELNKNFPAIKEGEKYLVTADNWFIGTDGHQYRAAWGKVKMLTTTEVFGFVPAKSTNWFLQIGEGENAVFIAGCQIHYVIKCDARPTLRIGNHRSQDTAQEYNNNQIFFTE